MMQCSRRVFLFAGSLLLAASLTTGCASSPPLRLYTLTTVPPATASAPAASIKPARLERLTIPGELDRPQLIRRIDATQLLLAEQDRWAAPLEDLIRRALLDDLAARVPGGLVTSPGNGAPVRSVSIDLQEFMADAACNVTLRARWTLTQPGLPAVQGNETISEPVGSPCETRALPNVMSRALARLSDQLAIALAR